MDIRPLTHGPSHHYFGYYDKSPWNADGSLLLAHELESTDRAPAMGVMAKIGIIDAVTGKFSPVSETATWNLQQGSMLQWLPPTFDNTLIHNAFENGRYVSVLMSSNGDRLATFDQPIYCVAPDGKSALTLDFSRLHRLRPGYGYINLPDATKNDIGPKFSGISQLDLVSGQSQLLVSIDFLKNLIGSTSPETDHWVNHLEFNPSGDRFMFVLRWTDGARRLSRLIVCNADGGQPIIVADDGIVSHSAWKSDSEILSWSGQADTGIHYHVFDINSGESTTFAPSQLLRDGHPSYSPDGGYVLTDTYPDRSRMQSLFLADSSGSELRKLGAFRSPLKYRGEIRCDLHPRWRRDGLKVCIDSTHSGTRQMYEIDIEPLLGDLTRN
ncbi:MAG: hypothetical protein HOE75_08500 [Chloroflexi bacterium]|nr:hypothetical protein [Chloroflexota bacterium]